jgi:hypothetical protein
VDPFTVVVFAGLAVMVLFIFLLGKYNEGSPLDQIGLRSPREIVENREALEAEDLEQMLAAANERRRRRGAAEITVEDVELQVMRDTQEQQRRRTAYMADLELDELLAATNERRRARGLPERTREEVQREFGGDGPAHQA